MATADGVLHVIPTARTLPDAVGTLAKYAPWSYRFVFSNGAITETGSEIADNINQTKAELIFPLLDAIFHGRWPQIRCLDVACHEGWFATQIALRGAGEVVGIDIREEHLAKASAIRDLAEIYHLTFSQDDLYRIKPEQHGAFDLTLFLGILYHLDNPLEAPRNIRSLTRGLCVIESQMARPGPELECMWGSGVPRKGPSIAVVPSDEGHVEQGKPVVLVPTVNALYEMLYAVGFDRLYLSVPYRSMYDQYTDYDRVVIFAQTL